MRSAALRFTNWPITAAGLSMAEPAAIIEGGVVTVCSPAAYRHGIRIGQRRREAKGHSPALTVLAADPFRDAQAFEPVVATLLEAVPRLEVSEPGLCTVPVAGPSRYYGGERELITYLLGLWTPPLDQTLRIGIADSRFGAKCAAQTTRDTTGEIVPVGRTQEFLAPFPISTLGIDELSTLSRRLGIHTLGQFAALPTRSVLSRFGSSAAQSHALARGIDPTPLAIHHPTQELAVTIELDPPAERVDIATFSAKSIVTEFMELLAQRGLACTQLRIELQTEHAEENSRLWRASPVFDGETILERIRWQLAGWLTGSKSTAGIDASIPSAGISLIRLTADEVAGSADLQVSLWGEMSAADRRAVRGLDRVRGLLGPTAVFTVLLGGGRGPHERVHLVPWGKPTPTIDPPMPWPGQIPAPSPAVLYQKPLQIGVFGTTGPVQVTARGDVTARPTRLELADGKAETITGWTGPWLTDERWWESESHRRYARFQLITTDSNDAQHAHLCLVQGNTWLIEATYD
ncbi:MAG: DNA polymerase Y family protein [Actinobacteria bacterium]|nr:DNA polymerase Y family protein [Actinomycetota bacterium]